MLSLFLGESVTLPGTLMPPGLGGGKFGDGKAVAPVEEVAEKGGRRTED
jgi:hypothetical protein